MQSVSDTDARPVIAADKPADNPGPVTLGRIHLARRYADRRRAGVVYVLPRRVMAGTGQDGAED